MNEILGVPLSTNSLVFDEIAASLISVCCTCKLKPKVKFIQSRCKLGNAAQTLALAVDNAFKQFQQMSSIFSEFSDATLLILDRSYDVLTPLIHDFAYQSVVADLVGLQNGNRYLSAAGKDTKTLVLDDSDKIWTSLRHMHLAECTDRLIQDFNRFEAENKLDADADLTKMQFALANIGDYQLLKEKVRLD